MRLDVIVPTYNRQELLVRTLDSLLMADIPNGLAVQVTVVDNNSTDNTRQVVESRMQHFKGRLSYIFEGRPGKSFALNTGISSVQGDLVGMIDDDEEIAPTWYTQVHSAFSEDNVDFIGGPYVPRWGAERPEWLPLNYRGAIGWVDSGNERLPYGEDFPGILMGGNAVVKREVLTKAGPYCTSVGPKGRVLLRGEDDDMYNRLLKLGARGFYLPNLIIYHYVDPERLTKKYFRRWSFWRGMGMGILDKDHRQPVTYLAGVPRWLFGKAARGLLGKAKSIVRTSGDPAKDFENELAVLDLLGFFYGKHFQTSTR